MLGLEAAFCWIPWTITWVLSWLPKRGRLGVHQGGVKIKGNEVTVLEPGTYWWNVRWSEVLDAHVRTQTVDLCDQLLTTADGKRVRAGGILVFNISNIETWLVDNVDSDNALLAACARVIRDYVVQSNFDDLQTPSSRLRRDDNLTKTAQAELGARFGVRIHYLGLGSFATTRAIDLYHAGDMPAPQSSSGEEE